MTVSDLRDRMNIFGKIYANGDNYPKQLHGKITDIDRTMIEFTDNFGMIHLFKASKVIDFHPVALRRISWKMPKKFVIKK